MSMVLIRLVCGRRGKNKRKLTEIAMQLSQQNETGLEERGAGDGTPSHEFFGPSSREFRPVGFPAGKVEKRTG
jgi:hypothetical protein